MRHNRGMGLAAAGAYLEEVRQSRRVTRKQLAADLDISSDQIERIEKGRTKVNGPALLRLISRLEGSYQQVVALLNDDLISLDDARALARAWASRTITRDPDDGSVEFETAELVAIALQRTGGDRAAARRLLLRALYEADQD